MGLRFSRKYDQRWRHVTSYRNHRKKINERRPLASGCLLPQHTRLPSVDVQIKIGEQSLPFSFRPDLLGRLIAVDEGNISEELLNRMIYLYLRINCMYRREFDVDGESCSVYLGDANCNGLFHERFALRGVGTPLPGCMPIFSSGDNFFISQEEDIDVNSRQICGDWLLVKNKLFEVKIDQAEQKLTLTPVMQNLIPSRPSLRKIRLNFKRNSKTPLFAKLCRP